MRKAYCLVIIIAIGASFGADLATVWGPRAAFQITFRIVDDEGLPVEGATLGCSWGRLGFGPPDAGQINLLSDENGRAIVSARSVFNEFNYHGEKAGFYSTHSIGFDLPVFHERANGRWEPWNPTIKILLKRIVSPAPMYAKRLATRLPLLDAPICYDLELGDWLPPQGNGKISDVIFVGHLAQRGKEDWDWELKVSFSNPGDGLQRFQPDSTYGGSELRSSHEAPPDGYLPKLTLVRSRQPNTREQTTFKADGGYFFRVRTQLDAQGQVVKAWYGKIYGDFFDMVYYLNPDGTRNVEFDPKRNLFKSAKPGDSAFWNLGP